MKLVSTFQNNLKLIFPRLFLKPVCIACLARNLPNNNCKKSSYTVKSLKTFSSMVACYIL